MKVCVAQTRSVKGKIIENIERHKRVVTLAISHGAEMIVFPELSLTGYEPTLAKQLAITTDDDRLQDFQKVSDAADITIGVGAPTKTADGICISMILFQPYKPRQTYSKHYLHPDEEEFFVAGKISNGLIVGNTPVALAICYELSVPEHSARAFKNGAKVYITSVAKSASGVEKASASLSKIAARYSMTVLMANGIGFCDNFESVGKSAIWNSRGKLLRQLDDVREGILIVDTESEKIVEEEIEAVL